jgi:dTDP-4-dehydrorhamnose 3,5-epimerase
MGSRRSSVGGDRLNLLSTAIPGVVVIEADPVRDARGFFARIWSAYELRERNVDVAVAQASLSWTERRGTLRGLHFQRQPWGETKVVRCVRGAIYDVVVDLRRDSPAHRSWIAFELTQENRRAVCMPPGVAHGFQTMVDDCEVLYQMSVPYHAESSAGVRWNDVTFGIEWPIVPPLLSDRDASYPDYSP